MARTGPTEMRARVSPRGALSRPVRSQRASRAMAHLPEHDPALAALLLWCEVLDGTEATLTCGETIRIGPEFDSLPLREQIAVLGHHVLHIALRHSGRMAGLAARQGGLFDPLAYNLAADALVNSVLIAGGHAVPRPAVTLETFGAEVLRRPAEDLHVTDWDVERLYIAAQAAAEAQGGKGQQETYARRKAFDADLEPNGPGETRETDAAWQGHLERALKGQGGSGRGIGAVLAGLGDVPEPKLIWEQHLRRLLSKALLQVPRISYARPRRAWIAREALARQTGSAPPAFEPGATRDARQPRVVVGVDSSGSIPDAQLAQFAGEIISIARRVQAELHVLWFDEVVYAHQTLTQLQREALLSMLKTRRDGGTSFIDVLERAGDLDPSVIVILSDLDGPFGSAPEQPVIWATPDFDAKMPPFGQILQLSA